MTMPEVPPSSQADAWWAHEHLDPRHFYAGYTFDDADARQRDVVTLIEEARRLGYPVRYWWLSDVIDLEGAPDRLVVCVHHPSADTNAGMDLVAALRRRGVSWDDLESASVVEYQEFSKPIEGRGGIARPDGQSLFPLPTVETVPEPLDSPAREDEPLWVLTLGEVQEVALEELGRFLTDEEVASVMDNFRAAFNWAFYVANCIQAGQERGRVGPAAEEPLPDASLVPPPDEGPLPEPIAPGDAVSTSFLVYYALGGMMLARAADAKAASKSAFASLHRLIGRAEIAGVTPRDASHVRWGDLDITIESVEAIEFPLDET